MGIRCHVHRLYMCNLAQRVSVENFSTVVIHGLLYRRSWVWPFVEWAITERWGSHVLNKERCVRRPEKGPMCTCLHVLDLFCDKYYKTLLSVYAIACQCLVSTCKANHTCPGCNGTLLYRCYLNCDVPLLCNVCQKIPLFEPNHCIFLLQHSTVKHDISHDSALSCIHCCLLCDIPGAISWPYFLTLLSLLFLQYGRMGETAAVRYVYIHVLKDLNRIIKTDMAERRKLLKLKHFALKDERSGDKSSHLVTSHVKSLVI